MPCHAMAKAGPPARPGEASSKPLIPHTPSPLIQVGTCEFVRGLVGAVGVGARSTGHSVALIHVLVVDALGCSSDALFGAQLILDLLAAGEQQHGDDVVLCGALGLEDGQVAGGVLDPDVGARGREERDGGGVAVEGGPVQRRVAGRVFGVDEGFRGYRGGGEEVQ